ncbi:hypothetical protein [Flagellimonas oceanensis]|uniref:hypothetical protein n=1 Tax=Flagellimonas oceanensis TaxID=2499163 RepID=UPI000C98DE2A|nr:hypothetical protein [Allomuricauda sp.]
MIQTPLKVNQDINAFKSALHSIVESKKPGIYFLCYYTNGKPRAIQRLHGSDKNGVLYIGMTEGALFDRVSNLQHALLANSKLEMQKPASSGHTQMGLKYFRIRNKVPIDSLFIHILPDDSPKQAESEALENYVNAFAELPPLNGQYGSCTPNWSKYH